MNTKKQNRTFTDAVDEDILLNEPYLQKTRIVENVKNRRRKNEKCDSFRELIRLKKRNVERKTRIENFKAEIKLATL